MASCHGSQDGDGDLTQDDLDRALENEVGLLWATRICWAKNMWLKSVKGDQMAKHFITACWLPGIRSDPPPFGGAPCMLSCDIFLQLFFPGSLTTSHRCQWWIQKTWCDSSISVVAGSWATSPSPVVTLRRQLRGSRSRESGGHVSFTEHLGRCDLNRSQSFFWSDTVDESRWLAVRVHQSTFQANCRWYFCSAKAGARHHLNAWGLQTFAC